MAEQKICVKSVYVFAGKPCYWEKLRRKRIGLAFCPRDYPGYAFSFEYFMWTK